jgi:hypothetical protein
VLVGIQDSMGDYFRIYDAFTLQNGKLIPAEIKTITVPYTFDNKNDAFFPVAYTESENNIIPLSHGWIPALETSYFITSIPNNTTRCIIKFGDENTFYLNLKTKQLEKMFDETGKQKITEEYDSSHKEGQDPLWWAIVLGVNPSGTKLIFVSNRLKQKDGTYHCMLWVKDLVTGRETQLPFDDNFEGWKNDHEFYCEKQEPHILELINIDTKKKTPVLDEITYPQFATPNPFNQFVFYRKNHIQVFLDLDTNQEYQYDYDYNNLQGIQNIWISPEKTWAVFQEIKRADDSSINKTTLVFYNLKDGSTQKFYSEDFDAFYFEKPVFIDENIILLNTDVPYYSNAVKSFLVTLY